MAVLFEQQEHVAVITLNRPERRNAINIDLINGIRTSLDRAASDSSIRAVVVTGAGKGFCAGADLSDFATGFTPEFGRNYIVEHYQPMMEAFTQLRKPIVGAINGAAAGAGAAIALACDLRVMAESASMFYAFINIGLGPDGGASWFLARQVGYSRALEIALEGKPISAAQCLDWGLTNRVADDDKLLDSALDWAHSLAKRPTLAAGITKLDLQKSLEVGLKEAIEYEADLQMDAFASHDLQEGIKAFFEKRAPNFRGE